MVVYAYDTYTGETETGGLPQVQSQPGLHVTFQGNLEYKVRPCLNKRTQKKIFFIFNY